MEADIPRPPDRPQDYECCRRGCCPCIFDYYEDALARWDARVRALGRDPDEVLGEARRRPQGAKTFVMSAQR